MQRGGVFVYVSLISIRLSPFAVRALEKLIISNKQPVMAKGERRMIILTTIMNQTKCVDGKKSGSFSNGLRTLLLTSQHSLTSKQT